jgi:outer membrane scaffolding protein for murein synthesis (MipA/OmpV family)
MPFMTAIAFDTMKLVRRLEAAGMDQPQATGVAEALAETMVVEPATRADLQHLDARVTGEIAGLRSDMQHLGARLTGEIATLRMDMQRLDSRLAGEIAGLRSDMQVEFAKVRGEMQAGFASTKVELLRWILPLFLAQMAMIIGVLVRLQP